MIVCRVIGTVVQSSAGSASGPLLIVQPIDQEGRRAGRELVAIARVRTAIGDLVLVDQDVRGHGPAPKDAGLSVQAAAVAVIEGLNHLNAS
jgi:microcompartment protein CcmK/EutM